MWLAEKRAGSGPISFTHGPPTRRRSSAPLQQHPERYTTGPNPSNGARPRRGEPEEPQDEIPTGDRTGGPPLNHMGHLGPTAPRTSREKRTRRKGPPNPLKGIHFGALKAPGPSGMIPEHISELLSVRRRVANKALAALDKLQHIVSKGGLDERARWITFSRTIFVRKKVGITQ